VARGEEGGANLGKLDVGEELVGGLGGRVAAPHDACLLRLRAAPHLGSVRMVRRDKGGGEGDEGEHGCDLQSGGGLGVRGASRAHGVHVLVALLSWREGGSRRRAQGDSRCRFVKRCPLPYTPSSPISLKCCNQLLEARMI